MWSYSYGMHDHERPHSLLLCFLLIPHLVGIPFPGVFFAVVPPATTSLSAPSFPSSLPPSLVISRAYSVKSIQVCAGSPGYIENVVGSPAGPLLENMIRQLQVCARGRKDIGFCRTHCRKFPGKATARLSIGRVALFDIMTIKHGYAQNPPLRPNLICCAPSDVSSRTAVAAAVLEKRNTQLKSWKCSICHLLLG